MPITEQRMLPTGRIVTLTMPDLYSIMASVGRVPSPHIAAVLDLLIQDKAYTPEGASADVYIRKRDEVRGRYALAALCLVSPRLVLDRAPKPEEDEIGPGDLSWVELEAIHLGWFQYWRTPDARRVSDPADADGAQEPPPAGDDVPDDAKRIPRGRRAARQVRP
jgi:hypothetical protein